MSYQITSYQYIQVIKSNKSYQCNSQIHKVWTHDISCKSLTVTHTKKINYKYLFKEFKILKGSMNTY